VCHKAALIVRPALQQQRRQQQHLPLAVVGLEVRQLLGRGGAHGSAAGLEALQQQVWLCCLKHQLLQREPVGAVLLQQQPPALLQMLWGLQAPPARPHAALKCPQQRQGPTHPCHAVMPAWLRLWPVLRLQQGLLLHV
jgi:hypothetical protein